MSVLIRKKSVIILISEIHGQKNIFKVYLIVNYCPKKSEFSNKVIINCILSHY